ncbi:MAG: chorismate mutase [Roseivivax sp.]|nr:chorismate mutase [Roseivivax sp.]
MVLLAERLRYADRAPVLKRRAGVSAAAPSRQRDVVERVRARAEATGFDPALAEAMWRVMIDGIVAREERVIGKEGTDG